MAETLTTERLGPGPAPAAAHIHPKLAQRLDPGERVIAAGRTSGPDLTIVEMVVFGILTLAFTSVLGPRLMRAFTEPTAPAIAGAAFAAGFFALLAFIIAGAAYGRDGAHYALTDRRVLWLPRLFAPSWFPNNSWSLSGRRITRDMLIRQLSVMGAKTRGRITLRNVSLTNCPAIVLTGIDNPLDFAALIKSTLALDLPVEDYTR